MARVLSTGTRLILFLILLPVVFLGGCRKAVGPDQRIVIMVGVDGFRWDYLEKFHPPNLLQLASQGVTAERMIPAFPTLTFPNFYTLATGLRPENHGIIANTMFDPEFDAKFSLSSPSVQESRWWGGEPIWVTAENQGVRSACMFWPGSEAEIAGVRPSAWRKFDAKFSPDERVKTVLDWLTQPPATRPRLITVYFHEADTAGHHFGPDSPEVADAVAKVDAAIGKLVEGIQKLGLKAETNLLIVSDHGMTEVSPQRVIPLDRYLDLESVQIDFSGAVGGLRPLRGTAEELYEKLAAEPRHFRVYRREEVPERLHFRKHRRIPPVIIVPDEGWMIVRKQSEPLRGGLRATHGFDPAFASMGALFIGWGPAFRHGVVLPPFENIQVYNLAGALLGLRPAANDGDQRLAGEALLKN
jgi:predicted AlkP superfamily pyrophosphatase or phosphodiesterase